MLTLFDRFIAGTGNPVSVVADQVMSPCWAGFLAESLLDLMRLEFSGIMHVACAGGPVSWYSFAKQIASYAYSKNAQPEILETTLASFPRPAPRPKYSALYLSL